MLGAKQTTERTVDDWAHWVAPGAESPDLRFV
jgi:hypothetical protein